MSGQRFCRNCGSSLDPQAAFCRECGSRTRVAPAPSDDPSSGVGADDSAEEPAAILRAPAPPLRDAEPQTRSPDPPTVERPADARIRSDWVAEQAARLKGGDRDRRPSNAVWAGLGLIAAVVVTVVVLFATGSFSATKMHPRSGGPSSVAVAGTSTKPQAAPAQHATPTAAQTTGTGLAASTGTATSTGTGTGTGTNGSIDTTTDVAAITPGVARSQVVAVLETYAQAFTSRSISQLSPLLASNVSRRGLASNGCTTSQGRSAVLADYAAQFKEPYGTYSLVNLSPGEVDLTGSDAASVATQFAIADGNSGSIGFTLNHTAVGWQIVNISAKC